MAQQQPLHEDEARQIIGETAVIDHLVQTFHSDQVARPAAPYCLSSEAVFNRIRSAHSSNT
jgi:hypothetical protein